MISIDELKEQLPVARTNNIAAMLGAQVKAQVESRYLMALHRPRNIDNVRALLLKECARPSFAKDKSTLYKKPIGAGIEGLGIRFAEVAIRCMTNVLVQTTAVHEDESMRIVNVAVTDLESNITYDRNVTVQKTVERSRPSSDGSFISVRTNSQGQAVYTLQAQDDEILNKEGALISKAIRTLCLRLIPGDLQDECEALIRRIRLDEAAKDPDSERRKLCDAFASLSIFPKDLEDYLGHPLSSVSPAELADLRGVYGAIRDNETTWNSILESRESSTADLKELVDSSGAKFDESLHSSNKDGKPTFNKDGTFRKKRVQDKEPTETQALLDKDFAASPLTASQPLLLTLKSDLKEVAETEGIDAALTILGKCDNLTDGERDSLEEFLCAIRQPQEHANEQSPRA